MKHKRKRSEYTYIEIVRNLMWYYWDLWLLEDEEIDKRYYRLYHIANADFYKPYGRSIARIAERKWFSLDDFIL